MQFRLWPAAHLLHQIQAKNNSRRVRKRLTHGPNVLQLVNPLDATSSKLDPWYLWGATGYKQISICSAPQIPPFPKIMTQEACSRPRPKTLEAVLKQMPTRRRQSVMMKTIERGGAEWHRNQLCHGVHSCQRLRTGFGNKHGWGARPRGHALMSYIRLQNRG